jgi:class 3 adenylate cyclase
MKCRHCGFENPEGAKFCQNCGQPQERLCPNCGTANSVQAKFCLNCGNRLVADAATSASALNPSSEARLARLAAAAPPQLARKMKSAAQVIGERRIVTALFADVVGSTSLTSQMDAEDWTAIMNRAFDLIMPAIYHYEGTIARLMGDALLAFFGAPVAHEDDPQRAVRAGLDILATVAEYASEVRQQYGIDFAMRIGLNTGPVVVGEVGSNLVYEYTAMGDAINLAARLQSAARPMTVLIGENTYRFIAPLFECTDLGKINVKGIQEPVQVYEVKEAKTVPGKLRGLAGIQTTMVGRQDELARLLQLTQIVQAGIGRVVIISGEAGLGKSRLILELRKVTTAVPANSNLVWAEGHCLSYGQGLAYHLLADLTRAIIAVPASAGDPQILTALKKFCARLLGKDDLNVYPFLANLLSLDIEGPAAEKMSNLDPQSLQMGYLNALRQLLSTLAAQKPLVIVLEDIHWADPSSIELLSQLLALAKEAPLLFCILTRPDYSSSGWRLVRAAHELLGTSLEEIHLISLSETETSALIVNLLKENNLPGNLQRLILKKSEGNPFFVEEVIRMLIERGLIVKENGHWAPKKEIEAIEIPDNLQGLLLARIDRLPEDAKRILRIASVIGRQFSVNVLEKVEQRQQVL